MISGLSTYQYRIATFYRKNAVDLGETLTRLSTGKKINNPIDDAVGYIRAQSFELDHNAYENIKTELSEWQGAMNIAGEAADSIYDDLTRMQELIYLASQSGATASELSAYTSEFQQLGDSMEGTVQNTTYAGASLLNTAAGGDGIADISLSPGSTTNTLKLDPGIAVAAATLTDLKAGDLTDAAGRTAAQVDVTAALGDIQPYIAKVSSYDRNLQSHINISDTVMENAESAQSLITDIDEAEEMITYTAQEIRQQSAMAMLAQANMSQRSVLYLYGLTG